MKRRHSQQGVALVITLILLSVITFMAVTFLVVSRKEASQVNTLQQQSNAKFAADAALEEAKAQAIVQMLTSGNGLNFSLLVSTNFVSAANFVSGNTNLTNVLYTNLASSDLFQMLNNLQILPRPPVFIITNNNKRNPLYDFRYYLDLNRNGRYDTNGAVLEHDPNSADPNSVTTNVYVGDPEWVGILNHPDQRHSSSNFFIGRYCFIALPIGNSLDINFIHNESKQLGVGTEGYLRNEGVGSWEINLAAFLHTLNSNWDNAGVNYGYNTNSISSRGTSFADATSILQYRYNNSYNNLRSFSRIYGNPAGNKFSGDFIDGYSHGPLMTGLFPLVLAGNSDPDKNLVANTSWSGDNSINTYFTTQDLFNLVPYPNNSAVNAAQSFSNHLYQAGRNFNAGNAAYSQLNASMTNSYNRYTFYRMLSQMSFSSAPESSLANNTNVTSPFPLFNPSLPGYYPYTNRMNLNYCNVGATNATNFQNWDPVMFFTNCANLLLANAGFTNTVANIQIYPTNYYTPAMNRLLQLAANIYDATTNHPFDDDLNGATGLYYPSVFRPQFSVTTINGTKIIYISGYTNVPRNLDYQAIPLSLDNPIDRAAITSTTTNVYGIPWIIGAKKGFPNFNEFSMNSVSQITRKLQFVNLTPGSTTPTFQTNVQYVLGISNVVGVEAWNSYQSTYPRSVDLVGVFNSTVYITNELGVLYVTNFTGTSGFGWNSTIVSGLWGGAVPNSAHQFPSNSPSFQVPLLTNAIILPDSVYHPTPTPHFTTGTNFDVLAPYLPHFGVNLTNRLRFVILDHTTQRVIDYVAFDGMNVNRDLTGELQGTGAANAGNPDDTAVGGKGGVWLTNLQGGTMAGIINQIQISKGLNPGFGFNIPQDWNIDQLQQSSISSATAQFNSFLGGNTTNGVAMQAPYTPTRKVSLYFTWQANDPLVHYTLGDLTPQPPVQSSPTTNYYVPSTANSNSYAYVLPNIHQVNQRYFPWNDFGNPTGAARNDTNKSSVAIKDSQVVNSDAWQFPTNKFPNIGWLGRVHRGTPWQTVYLKSAPIDLPSWANWTGNTNLTSFGTNTTDVIYGTNMPNAFTMMPTNDWNILNLFTTAPNDNATRGQLSVNQTNMAAWAALLDGVLVLSNTTGGLTNMFIDPNTNLTAFLQLVNGINSQRTNFPKQVFTTVGQILSVPQLTVQSPYINTTMAPQNSSYPSDMVMERIPEQILSLLRVGSPRYVIFAYGQSLMPADHSIVQSGQFFGMCTNYQITGEVATRTVLRIDNPPVPGRQLLGQPRAVVESFNVLPPE